MDKYQNKLFFCFVSPDFGIHKTTCELLYVGVPFRENDANFMRLGHPQFLKRKKICDRS